MQEENKDTEASLPPTVTPEGEVETVAEDTSAAPITEEEPQTDYAALAASDLAEIKRLDAAYAPATPLSELPFARRFAELRDLGLSVAEALAAASPRFDVDDGRAHLRAMAPRGTSRGEDTLSRTQMKEAKLLFNGLSEREINALYRRVSQKNHD